MGTKPSGRRRSKGKKLLSQNLFNSSSSRERAIIKRETEIERDRVKVSFLCQTSSLHSLHSSGQSKDLYHHPTNNATLNKLPTELQCKNFDNKHRLRMLISAKRTKTCMHYVRYIFQLSFHSAYHRWWLGNAAAII